MSNSVNIIATVNRSLLLRMIDDIEENTLKVEVIGDEGYTNVWCKHCRAHYSGYQAFAHEFRHADDCLFVRVGQLRKIVESQGRK